MKQKLNKENCGTAGSNWKPCIERKIADQVFGSCCERFVPPECRGLCIYETNAIEARVVYRLKLCYYLFLLRRLRPDVCSWPGWESALLMHTIQPSRCRLYKYLPAVVHCAAQTHDNTECCRANGIAQLGEQCLQMCQPQANPRRFWGVKSLRKDMVVCLAKWDQIMQCHQSGLRARKVPRPTA
ncbi:DB module [Ancylostoma ceylanicum]|uniref:DB module n=1 Tax=Ancylostoma ceylanicum TaxID=53326 RepID=A0A0D6M9M5_9BILA|nr:DB module [Ancylostoma ceylanicum]